jgi:hypothetical protein
MREYIANMLMEVEFGVNNNHNNNNNNNNNNNKHNFQLERWDVSV